MSTPHRTGIRVAIPALFLLAACPALGAFDSERVRPGPNTTHNARFQPNDLVGASVAPDTIRTRNLLLWGGIDADRVPFLDPVFVIDAPPSLPDVTGDYRVGGRAVDGTVLFSLDFEMPVIADGDGSSSFLFMLPVQPGWEGRLTSVTLTRPGRIGHAGPGQPPPHGDPAQPRHPPDSGHPARPSADRHDPGDRGHRRCTRSGSRSPLQSRDSGSGSVATVTAIGMPGAAAAA